MTLAPVVLFVYNRPQHTRETLTALRNNRLAEASVLYIFADGPKPGATDEELDAIAATRKLVQSEQWCGQQYYRFADSNKGLAKSIIDGVTEIVQLYGKVIVLEDDLQIAENFLQYCNNALEFYEYKENVYGISGYAFAEGIKKSGTYLLPIGSSWGWATWANRWAHFNQDAQYLMHEINHRGLKDLFNFGGYPFWEMLQMQVDGKIDSWAIRFYASFFLRQGYFLFPAKSLVGNTGFDGSGTHIQKGAKNPFHAIPVNEEIEIAEIDDAGNKGTIEAMREVFLSRTNANDRSQLSSSKKSFTLKKWVKGILNK